MTARSKGWQVVLLPVLSLALAGPAWARMTEEQGSSQVNGALRKLGRGIANIVTCPAELLRTPDRVGRQDGYIAAVTVGVLQGAARTIFRGTAGIFEVATFFLEIPKGYRPLIEPEFVWAHGDWAD